MEPEVQSRIYWTTSQVEKVHDRIVDLILERYPEIGLSEAECSIPSSFIRKVLPEAQLVLDVDYHRRFWSDKQLLEWSTRCSTLLRKRRIDIEKDRVAIMRTPTDELMSELARRMEDSLMEKLLDRLEGPLMKRLEEKMEARLNQGFSALKKLEKHNPTMSQTPDKKPIPTYAVVGLLGGQASILESKYRGRCRFKFATAEEYQRMVEISTDRVCFVMTKFVNHSVEGRLKDVSDMRRVNGGTSELETLVNGALYDFAQLS